MKRGAPMKRTAFARKSNSENIPSKVAQSHIQRAHDAINIYSKNEKNQPFKVKMTKAEKRYQRCPAF